MNILFCLYCWQINVLNVVFMRPFIKIFDFELMRKEQRTEQNKHYSIPGEAALVQVQILYQKTHSGMQYLENWKIFQNEKSLQACITQILIEQWTVGGVSHDGCCWPWSQGLVNLKQYCITSPQLCMLLIVVQCGYETENSRHSVILRMSTLITT